VSAPRLRFGPLVIDRDLRAALIDGRALPLTPKAFELLLLLADQSERVVLKSEMLEYVWPDATVEEANLSQTVFMLRQAFRQFDGTHNWIQTIPRLGYRFVAPPSLGDSGAPQTPAEMPSSAHGVDASRDATTSIASTKRLTGTWVGLAVVGASLAIVALTVLSGSKTETPLRRLEIELGPDVDLENFTAIISPNGERLVYVSRGRLFTQTLDRGETTELAGTQGASTPFFSPDGNWVAFFASGMLKKISMKSGTVLDLCPTTPAPFGGTTGGGWSEGGFIVAALSPKGVLWRLPASGGQPASVSTLDVDREEVTHRWPQLLPKGNAVLFTAHTKSLGGFDEASIEVLSLKDGRRKTLVRGGTFGRYLSSGHLVYIRKGVLFAASFDLNRLEVLESPSPVLDHVAYSSGNGGAEIDFSSNGTVVYRRGESAPERGRMAVLWLDRSGKTQPLLTKSGIYARPRLSPDGQRLAMRIAEPSGVDIAVYDMRRDAISRVTDGRGTPDAPVWSANGRYIVFTDLETGDLFWNRVDGGGRPQPLFGAGTHTNTTRQPYSFSADGKRLAFMETGAGGFDLWTVPLDDDGAALHAGTAEPFLRTSFDERHPAFSTDGRWLAYASNESGRFQVYVRAFPDDGHVWPVSNNGGVYPVWARNGNELFYRTEDQRVMIARYTAHRGFFRADKPVEWAGQRPANAGGIVGNFDVTPDGARLAILARVDALDPEPSHHLLFLENFFADVRKRASP